MALAIAEIRRSIGADVFPAHKCPSMKFFKVLSYYS